MAFDTPIGYSSHYNFPKYALGANPGADALNENLIEQIDAKIFLASQTAAFTFSMPIKNTASVISLEFEDNLKKSVDNKLDTIQPIKITSTPQFARIGIGGVADSGDDPFTAKIYGSMKVTEDLWIDRNVYIAGTINQVNVDDLDVVDHAVRLNKGGTNLTAVNGGLEMLGDTDAVIGSIHYTDSGWLSSTNLDVASGKVYKINGTEVLSATTLGTAVVNSSLTKVGIVTNGEWKATQIADTYIASAVNWNDANSKKHVHANATVLNAITESFTTALKTSYDSAVAASHSHSNITHLNAIDQSVATTATPTFSKVTLTNGELLTGAATNLVLNPLGKSVVPKATYDVNLGSATLKYLSIYGAELAVGQLVSQSTIATIGGRILVGSSTSLIAPLTNIATVMQTKYKNLGDVTGEEGSIVYFEANGNIEFMQILIHDTPDSGKIYKTVTGGYEYKITRNLDGTGANSWNAGDACFNTGKTGNGFIDLYSISGLKNTQYGPAIVGNVRNSSTYNDWSEVFAIGNMNGLYGYNSTVYGVGLGKYASNASHLTADATNGIRIRKGTITLAQWDASGNILVGEVGAGKSNVYITNGAVQLRNNTTALITLNADGSASFAGNISSTATITGGTIITNATLGNAYAKLFAFTQSVGVTSGALELGYNDSAIKKTYTDGVYGPAGSFSQVYNEYFATTNVIMKELSFVNVNSGAYTYNLEEIVFRTSTNPGVLTSKDKYFYYAKALFNEIQFGTNSTNYDVNLYRASANVLKTDDAFDAVGGFKVNGSALATSHLTALTASKIAVTDANGFLSASSIASSELFAPVYGAMRHTNNSTTLSSDKDWVKYTGFVPAMVKNCTVASSALTVGNAGNYLVSYTITYAASSSTGNTIIFDVFVNNSNTANEIGKKSTLVRDLSNETISCTFEISLAANDVLDLRMYSSDIDTVTFIYANLVATKISN